MSHPRVGLVAITVGLVVVLAAPQRVYAGTPGYTYRTVDAPGYANTFLYDVNDAADVVGQGFDANFAYSAGVAIVSGSWRAPLRVGAAPDTSLNSINAGDTIAGSYTDDTGTGRAFLLQSGHRHDFVASPSAQFTSAGVNDAGDVAGSYTTDDFATLHGFARVGNARTRIDVPWAVTTQVFQINDRDQVVGWFLDGAGNSHGFVASTNGRYTQIDMPGAYLTRAFGINNRGDVVGYFIGVRGGPPTGFLWRHGRGTAIPPVPGSVGTAPQGINDTGEIVGYYRSADGMFHGFTATR